MIKCERGKGVVNYTNSNLISMGGECKKMEDHPLAA